MIRSETFISGACQCDSENAWDKLHIVIGTPGDGRGYCEVEGCCIDNCIMWSLLVTFCLIHAVDRWKWMCL